MNKVYPHPVIGSTLDNGALVLDTRHEADDNGRALGYVLALVPHGSPTFAEYATWAYVVDERGQVTTAGHYHEKNLSKALMDLDRRFGG
jgi:hypothetical protein